MGKRPAARWLTIVTLTVLVTAIAMTWPSFVVSAQTPEPTVEQLKEALLTPADLGPGFFIVDESVSTESLEVIRFFLRPGAEMEQVYAGLEADVPTDALAIFESAVGNLPAELGLQDATISDRLTAEWLASGAVSYQFTGVSGGIPRLGIVYAWQQCSVFAALVMLANSGHSDKQAIAMTARYAALQRDKQSAVCAPCTP